MLKVIFGGTRFPCSGCLTFRAMQGSGKDWQVKGNKSGKISPLTGTSYSVLWPADAVTALTPPPEGAGSSF